MTSPLGPGRHWPFDFDNTTKCLACGAVLSSVAQLKEPCNTEPAGGPAESEEDDSC